MNAPPYDIATERLAVLAEGSFGVLESKLAAAMLRYRSDRIVCVIDSVNAGKRAAEVVGVGGELPIVPSLESAARFQPTVLVLGIAPPGGQLPDSWRSLIADALKRGWHIMSGMHQFLADDAEFSALARRTHAKIWDVRRPPAHLPIGTQRAKSIRARRVLTVGSDCRTGKMVTTLELNAEARRRGWNSAFCATGQIGMMISGAGMAVDAVVSDFISGATEEILLERASHGAEWLFVEGQGSLIHPAYSGVTLGLLHGSLPDAMILCHQPSRTTVARQELPIPSLSALIDVYETAAGWLHESRVVGIALNTFDLSESGAAAAVKQAEDETGLPATDPVRYGVAPLLQALEERAS
ncbi:MAG: DUF1611 domain-containing protein [Candidatus Poribacteria bacterium]|nr:DUF1611 domain-containing protein [Candidatus Poribacteria bacterium]